MLDPRNTSNVLYFPMKHDIMQKMWKLQDMFSKLILKCKLKKNFKWELTKNLQVQTQQQIFKCKHNISSSAISTKIFKCKLKTNFKCELTKYLQVQTQQQIFKCKLASCLHSIFNCIMLTWKRDHLFIHLIADELKFNNGCSWRPLIPKKSATG